MPTEEEVWFSKATDAARKGGAEWAKYSPGVPEFMGLAPRENQIYGQAKDIKISEAEMAELRKFEQTITASNPTGTAPKQGVVNPVSSSTVASVQPSPQYLQSPAGAANMMAGLGEMLKKVQEAMTGANAVAKDVAREQSTAIGMGAEAAAEIARLQAEETIAIEEKHAQLIKALGLDVTDPNSMLSQELQVAANARKQRGDLRNKITELQQTSFFENPFAWIMNQGELQKLVPQHNQLVDVENEAGQEITRMQAIATAAKNITPAKAADLLRAKAAANAKATAAKAQSDLAEIKGRNAAGDAKLMLDMYTQNRNVFQDLGIMEQREFQRKQTEMMNEATLENRRRIAEERAEKAAAKQLTEDQKAGTVALINSYRTAINGAGIAPLTVADFEKMPMQNKKMWFNILDNGGFGVSYAEAIPTINKLGNLQMAGQSGNAAMVEMARDLEIKARSMMPVIKEELKRKNILSGGQVNDAQLYAMAFDRLYQEHEQYARKGFDKSSLGTVNNPYTIDYDAAVAATAGRPVNNVVLDSINQFKAADPYRPLKGKIDDRVIMEAVKARVLSGEVNPAVAAQQVSAFYKEQADKTYIDGGLKYFGLPAVQDYIITPGASGRKEVDLFNPARVESYLVAEVARQRAIKTSPIYSGRGLGGNAPARPPTSKVQE
jgi:hypothetical protein